MNKVVINVLCVFTWVKIEHGEDDISSNEKWWVLDLEIKWMLYLETLKINLETNVD